MSTGQWAVTHPAHKLICAYCSLLQANVIGSGKRLTSTVNACGICGGELKDFSHLGEEVRARAVSSWHGVWQQLARSVSAGGTAWQRGRVDQMRVLPVQTV